MPAYQHAGVQSPVATADLATLPPADRDAVSRFAQGVAGAFEAAAGNATVIVTCVTRGEEDLNLLRLPESCSGRRLSDSEDVLSGLFLRVLAVGTPGTGAKLEAIAHTSLSDVIVDEEPSQPVTLPLVPDPASDRNPPPAAKELDTATANGEQQQVNSESNEKKQGERRFGFL